MMRNVGCFSETLATVWISVRLFSRVDPQAHAENILRIKALLEDVTHKRSLVSVGPLMIGDMAPHKIDAFGLPCR